MTAFDFPSSPTYGQVYQAYTWDSEKWISTIGGTGRSITPANLTGLIGWWDASVFASLTLSGANVQAVADQSGTGHHMGLTGGYFTPSYSATSLNSRPGMTWPSTGQLYGLSCPSFPLGTGNTLTIWAVFSLTNSGDNGRVISYTAASASHDYDNSGSFMLGRDNTTSNIYFYRNGAKTASTAYGYATPRRVIVTIKSDGTGTSYLDGVGTALTSTLVANFVSGGWMALGNSQFDHSGAFGLFLGIIGEVGVATGFTNAADAALLDIYLKNKWGL